MPDRDRDRVAAAEALAPDIADEIAKVRPITDWVPMGGVPVAAGASGAAGARA